MRPEAALAESEPHPVLRLVEVMARLRDPRNGCPWDLEQNFATIATYTVEEAYEVADAIARGDLADLRDELGDLLFQAVYHARLAEEAGAFDFADLARGAADKMVRRHPHVFGAAAKRTSQAHEAAWEAQKAEERAGKAARGSGALAGVPLALPALMRAAKLAKRAARVGFAWPKPDAVLDKIAEEVAELRAEVAKGDAARAAEELGDLLFASACLGVALGVDPEAALRNANAKFARRFAAVERALAAEGSSPERAGLERMQALWDAIKAEERAA